MTSLRNQYINPHTHTYLSDDRHDMFFRKVTSLYKRDISLQNLVKLTIFTTGIIYVYDRNKALRHVKILNKTFFKLKVKILKN